MKRTFHEPSFNTHESTENTTSNKHLRIVKIIPKSTFENLCSDIFLEIFQYLSPTDILYSFFNINTLLDNLLESYTHTLDIRFINKPCFQYFIQSILPSLTKTLRVLRVSNTYTFSQISDLVYNFNWSSINQLESLSFDSIKSDELCKYFLTIHSLLKQLWRLSLTFNEDDKTCEKLLLNHILLSQSSSIKNCFINGITFDLTKSIHLQCNKNLRELTITLTSINDLIILFRMISHLEILTCTIVNNISPDNLHQISSLDCLTRLTLIINQQMEFKIFQKILIPHTKLKHLSLKAILFTDSTKEIDGFELEKVFRIFTELIELHFYFQLSRSTSHQPINYVSDTIYRFSFTTHFWLSRSIDICSHFVQSSGQLYVYTIPFAFDTFDIDDDISQFFLNYRLQSYFNVRHLILSKSSNLYEPIYSTIILKLFPKVKIITSSSTDTLVTLTKHKWIRQKNKSNNSYVFTLNNTKSRSWCYRILNISSEDQTIFAHNSKHIRQLTIYEMTNDQLVHISYCFPCIHILILYVDTSEWFSSPSIDWLHHLLTNMVSLFSLTVYYPKDTLSGNVQNLFVDTLIEVKKYFYIKCTNGILNIWF